MRKLIAFLIVGLSLNAYADTKISAFPSTTTLNASDIIPVVTNPGSSPGNYSITKANLISTLGIGAISTNTILNQSTLQSGSTFYVSSGTVQGPLTINDQSAGSIISLFSQASGGTAAAQDFAIYGLSSGAGSLNQAGSFSAVGAATTNNGIIVSATGGTNNHAINISNGDIFTNSAAGTSGQVLTSAGAGNVPTWATVSGGGGSPSLQVTQSGVQITSPTVSMNFNGNDFILSAISSTSTIRLNPSTTNYIQNTSTLQSGATFYVSSGTAQNLNASTVTVSNAIQMNGSGNLSFVNKPDGLTYQILGSSMTSCTTGQTWVVGSSNTAVCVTSAGGGSGTFLGLNSSGNPLLSSSATLLAGSGISLAQAGSTITVTATGSGTPTGPNWSVQIDSNGAFGGLAYFTADGSSATITASSVTYSGYDTFIASGVYFNAVSSTFTFSSGTVSGPLNVTNNGGLYISGTSNNLMIYDNTTIGSYQSLLTFENSGSPVMSVGFIGSGSGPSSTGYAFKNPSGTEVARVDVKGLFTTQNIITTYGVTASTLTISSNTVINGDVNISSTVRLSGTSGTSGQPLLSGGVGTVPTWGGNIVVSTLTVSGATFSTLGGSATNGSYQYCSDCTVTTPATCTANLLTSCVCAGSGTGAFAKRLNGTWYCN